MQGRPALVYTNHARKQMSERGITERMVQTIYSRPAQRVEVDAEHLTLNLFHRVAGVPIRVTLDPYHEIPLIITVAIASDNQLLGV